VLDHWFDTELVALAARRNPQWDFVLIGRRQDCDLSKLRRMPNVHLLDEVPYEILPQYVRGFDVCMIPFQISDLTLHTNPVKMYEYLAAGKPVVGTAMPEIMIGGEGLVYVANDHEQFMDKLAEAIAGHADPGYIERRVAYAMNETWARRVDQLESALANVTLHKSAADLRVSVPS
jgi:glycosyltransferase involved in cell wall biosynthesis